MARAKRHYIPGHVWHTPVEWAGVGRKTFITNMEEALEFIVGPTNMAWKQRDWEQSADYAAFRG